MARTFDFNSAKSCEVPTAKALADELAKLPNFQEFTETTSTADAQKQILLGIASDAWDDRQFGLDQLENEMMYAQILAPEDDSHQVFDGDTTTNSFEGGDLMIRFRRQVREGEDVSQEFLFFWDIVSAIGKDLHKATRNLSSQVRSVNINRTITPSRSLVDEESAQGEYLIAAYSVQWGDGEA